MFWNIEYKGKLKGDIEQISSGRPLSEGSVMFKEPDSITKVFVQGALFAIPIVALMIIFACFRIGAVYGKPTNMRFMDFMVPALSFPVSLVVVMYSVSMALCAIGDYLNFYNCITQVPKDGKVFNRGLHSYWV